MPSEKQIEAAILSLSEGGVSLELVAAMVHGNTSWGIKPGTLARALTAAEQAEPAPAIGAPIGAIENGRVFLQRLVDRYDFQCEAGGLANCSDYHEAVRCFEAMAEWIYHGQIADRDFWKEQFQIETRVRIEFQDALSNIANAYTAHGYSDAMDAVQNIKDIAKEALNAVR